MKRLNLPDGTSLTPMNVECPACFARAGKHCTIPTSDSRVDVVWFHLARESKLDEIARAMELG
ncbi:hypothetical protein SEA_LUKER_85 [Gordonia phage Luker]|nr:hypothetical protein SEA_LUKER_85 [Gordonia phage Luker]